MTSDNHLLIETDARGVARLTLNRPERHNAFDDALIGALDDALRSLAGDPAVRVLLLTGAGKSFSAGADIQWMRASAGYTAEQNVADALRLAQMLDRLDRFPRPTIGRINGNAYGGGVGLIACCDIVVAQSQARFALTEVRLGLVPAVISPYVVAAIGARHARRFFLSGEAMSAKQARRARLVHEIVTPENLDAAVDDQIRMLLAGGPQALAEAKSLIARLAGATGEDTRRWTAELIARIRTSPEGQEGLGAFLEKRPPRWRPPE